MTDSILKQFWRLFLVRLLQRTYPDQDLVILFMPKTDKRELPRQESDGKIFN